MSPGVNQTPWAATVRGPQKPMASRYSAGDAPCSRTVLHFLRRLSKVDQHGRVLAIARARTAFSVAVSSVYIA